MRVHTSQVLLTATARSSETSGRQILRPANSQLDKGVLARHPQSRGSLLRLFGFRANVCLVSRKGQLTACKLHVSHLSHT